jgi:hypothetical protein
MLRHHTLTDGRQSLWAYLPSAPGYAGDDVRPFQGLPTSQLILVDKMNHVFRTVDGDKQANIATYNNSSLPLADEFVKDITNFILKN